MKLMILAAATMLIGSAHAAEIGAGDMPGYAADITSMFTPALRKQCLDSLVANLNDPDSFKAAGKWFVSSYSANFHSSFGRPSEVMVLLPFRAKNEFGGLVLQVVACNLVQDPQHTLTFDHTSRRAEDPVLINAYQAYPIE